MKKLLVFSIVIILISCDSKSAFEYSESLVARETALASEIEKAEEDIARFYSSSQLDSAAIVSRKMEDAVEKIIQEVKEKPAPKIKEGERFKAAFIEYFQYIKSIYTSYRKIAEETDETARDEEYENLLQLAGNKDNAIKDMQQAQLKFAAANGIKVQE